MARGKNGSGSEGSRKARRSKKNRSAKGRGEKKKDVRKSATESHKATDDPKGSPVRRAGGPSKPSPASNPRSAAASPASTESDHGTPLTAGAEDTTKTLWGPYSDGDGCSSDEAEDAWSPEFVLVQPSETVPADENMLRKLKAQEKLELAKIVHSDESAGPSPSQQKGKPRSKPGPTAARTFGDFCKDPDAMARVLAGLDGTWPTQRFALATLNSQKLARFTFETGSDELYQIWCGIVLRLINADVVVVQELPHSVAEVRAKRLCAALEAVADFLVRNGVSEPFLGRKATWQHFVGDPGESQKSAWLHQKSFSSLSECKSSAASGTGGQTPKRHIECHVLLLRQLQSEEGSILPSSVPRISLQERRETPFSFNGFLKKYQPSLPPLCWDASTWLLAYEIDLHGFREAPEGSPRRQLFEFAYPSQEADTTQTASRLRVRVAVTSVHFPVKEYPVLQEEQIMTFFENYRQYCAQYLEIDGPHCHRCKCSTKNKGMMHHQWGQDDVLHFVLGDFNRCPTEKLQNVFSDPVPDQVAAAGFQATASGASSADSNKGKDRKAFDHILISGNAAKLGLMHDFASAPQHIDWSFLKEVFAKQLPGDHEPVIGQGRLQLKALLGKK